MKINMDFIQIPQQEEFLKEKAALVESLSQDPRVQQILIEKKIPASELETSTYLLDRWRKDQNTCASCTGLAACRQKRTGYRCGLRYDGILVETCESCPFERDHAKAISHMGKYLVSDLPRRMQENAFETIAMDSESPTYLKVLTTLIQSCMKEQGIYLYGSMGTGKTHLAACASNYFAKAGKSVAFIHYPTFCMRLNALLKTGEYRSEVERLSFAKMVVIDDIGAEEVTDKNRSILLSILDARMQNHLLTWFTSNEDYPSLENHFLTSYGKADPMEAARILERIKALTLPVLLVGEDRRK